MANLICKFWEPWKSNYRFTGFLIFLARIWGLIWFSGLLADIYIWEPWKWTYFWNIEKLVKLWYTTQILSNLIKKPSLLWVSLCQNGLKYLAVKLEPGFLLNCDKISMMYHKCIIFYYFENGFNFAIYKQMATLKIKSDPIHLSLLVRSTFCPMKIDH